MANNRTEFDSTGSEVTVQGNAIADFLLLPEKDGLLLNPNPLFLGKVMTSTAVTVWDQKSMSDASSNTRRG